VHHLDYRKGTRLIFRGREVDIAVTQMGLNTVGGSRFGMQKIAEHKGFTLGLDKFLGI